MFVRSVECVFMCTEALFLVREFSITMRGFNEKLFRERTQERKGAGSPASHKTADETNDTATTPPVTSATVEMIA